MKKMLLVAVMLVVTLFFMASPAYAVQFVVSGDSRIGCKDKDFYEELISKSEEGKKSEVTNDFMLGILSGECIVLKNGEEVFVTDTSAISEGIVKIRRIGGTSGLWFPAPWLTETEN